MATAFRLQLTTAATAARRAMREEFMRRTFVLAAAGRVTPRSDVR
jgi:hypothetical protein